MLTWMAGILAAVFMGVGTLLYQRTSSVETSLNQRIDDLKEDISENKSMIAENRAILQRVLEKLNDQSRGSN